MTTKKQRVVADDVLGQISRRTWDLQRRVMEGTLDPQQVLNSLQSFAEGHPVVPTDAPPFILGQRVYEIEQPPSGVGILAFAQSSQFEVYGAHLADQWPKTQRVLDASQTSKVRVAYFQQTFIARTAFSIVQDSGIECADAWELVAFCKQSSFIAARDFGFHSPVRFVSAVGIETGDDFLGDRYIYLESSTHARKWGFNNGCEGAFFKINAGDYVLVHA